jgi:hypothetical protein
MVHPITVELDSTIHERLRGSLKDAQSMGVTGKRAAAQGCGPPNTR